MTMRRTGLPGDRILLRGLVFFGYHGVNPEEQKLGQRFRVDVTLWVDLRAAAESDDLAATISYADVFAQVQAVMEGEPSRLLEHVAGRIGRALLADRRVALARVRIEKLQPPITGMATGTAGVELDFEQPPRHGL
ncbi:MAG TPA: dihydroneopterin aldolase [Chloroflexia bacterium]|nr:dihydroneopterin aldolase [Chloroflexia bacterium]